MVLIRENNLVKRTIIPKRAFYRGRSKEITYVDDHLIIKEYRVIVHDDKIIKVILENCRHPNADPYTNEFCLPETLIGLKFTEKNLQKVDKALSIYNLLSCYEIPYEFFKVEGGWI